MERSAGGSLITVHVRCIIAALRGEIEEYLDWRTARDPSYLSIKQELYGARDRLTSRAVHKRAMIGADALVSAAAISSAKRFAQIEFVTDTPLGEMDSDYRFPM